MNHLVDWYSKGFWLATFSLVAWQLAKSHDGWSRIAQLGLVLGLSIYAISFSFIEVTAVSKLVILSRDMVLLGFVSIVFQALRSYKSLYWLSVILLYALSKLFIGEWQKAAFSSVPVYAPDGENEWELLVQLKDKDALKDIQSVVDKYRLITEPAFKLKDASNTDLDEYISIEVPQKNESLLLDIKSELSVIRNVQWLEDNEIIKAEENPAQVFKSTFKPLSNDPHSEKQWAIEALGWNQVLEKFNETHIKPTKRSKIFILDTGIDGNHEDLKDNYVSIDSKYDTDELGHGTHCAGIAAAVTNNEKGISSVSPGPAFVSVSSIKVLGRFGAGTQRDIINGILQAADAGASVINLSLGGRSLDSKQKAYSDAVAYANAKGAIVVVAAGNDNADARGYAPANAQGVITVSAVDTNLNKASFSNSVEFIKYKISAPGTQIYSTIPNNQYAPFNGTSMAAPYVTGLVGMMKSIAPDLTTAQVYDILQSTGVEGKDVTQTGYTINADKAITKLLANLSSLAQ